MEYTELTETQMQIMNDVATTLPTFILGQATVLDTPDTTKRADVSNAEADKLVEIGFLEVITDKQQEFLKDLEECHGRKFRMFHITPMGEHFFYAQKHLKWVN